MSIVASRRMTELGEIEEEHHTPETKIQQEVADYFRSQPGVDQVEREVYQPGPYWFVDVVVEYAWGATLFIECENDWPSVRKGIGQAVGYAGDPAVTSDIPMVVFPAEHAEQPDLQRLQSGSVLVRPFDREQGVFVDV